MKPAIPYTKPAVCERCKQPSHDMSPSKLHGWLCWACRADLTLVKRG